MLANGSIRKQLIEAFRNRLVEIRKDNGFETDAGDQVFLGVPALTPDDDELAIGLVIGDEEPSPSFALFKTLPIEAVATAKDDIDDPIGAIEALIADIKNAIEQQDQTLGGLVKSISRAGITTVPREAGVTVVATRVTYLVRYCEGWGAAA